MTRLVWTAACQFSHRWWSLSCWRNIGAHVAGLVLMVAACPAACKSGIAPEASPATSEVDAVVDTLIEASLAASSSAAVPTVTVSASSSSQPSPVPSYGEQRLYSTGIETYVRALSSAGGRAVGYLRVGGAVRRSDSSVGSDGCKGGWYAVEPRGYVCVGESATLDATAGILGLAKPSAARGEATPYVYAKVRGVPPHYYAKIPTREDLRKVEGGEVFAHIERSAHSPDPNAGLLGPASEVPSLLAQGGRIPRPVGTAPRLRFWVHTGRADPNTRLAILSHFEADGRHYALTSQLDLVPMDRLQIVRPSTFKGIELKEGQSLPVGFVRAKSAIGYKPDEDGHLTTTVPLAGRQAMTLIGRERKEKGAILLENGDGAWVASSALLIVEPRKNIPSFVRNDDQRWLDIDIRTQTLVAYEGKKAVYVTMVSTGTGFLGDPETTHATPRGVFTIFSKHVSTKMSGDELGSEYLIDDVPYVQYFHKSYAIHGAFWHDSFGQVHSHGCVNLAPADAAWLFEFTSPEVYQGWHGAFSQSGGTTVFIHE